MIYEETMPGIYRYYYYKTMKRELSEDLTSEVFIRVYNSLGKTNLNKKTFMVWIYRIAHNEAINHLKKYSGKQISLDEVEYKIIDEKINLHQQIDKILLKNKVEKYLSNIQLKYREPLILFYFEQKSYEEISDILRVPKSTVGTLIRRGKDKLKELLLY